jgi:hypothetical protein
MPYIKDVDRDALVTNNCDTYYDYTINQMVDALQQHLQSLPDDQKEGCANYIITRIVAGGLKPAGGWRYMWLNRAYGTFLSAAAEFNRRLISNYENECIEKNGDIPEYEQLDD